MRKNDLIQHNGTILRILAINDSNALVIDCLKRNIRNMRKESVKFTKHSLDIWIIGCYTII